MATTSTRRSTSGKKKDGVRKQVQGYTLFYQREKDRMMNLHQGIPFRELQKKLGEAWRALDKSERDELNARADEMNRQAEAEEVSSRQSLEEEKRRRSLERKEQLELEKRRQAEEQERRLAERLNGKKVHDSL